MFFLVQGKLYFVVDILEQILFYHRLATTDINSLIFASILPESHSRNTGTQQHKHNFFFLPKYISVKIYLS